MFSVDELIEQIDQESDGEEIVEQDQINQESDAEEQNENTNNVEGNQDETENTEAQEADTNRKVDAPKRTKKPSNRPTLNAERLRGPRGLRCMKETFSKIQFDGKGHEEEDLKKVMNKLQYWCHRLFPKYSFDDTLEQIERLGTKRPVITMKKKILSGIIDEEPNLNVADEIVDEQTQEEAINDFDALLQQDPVQELQRTVPQSIPDEVVQLTEEQKQMIERNRQLAAERRRAKLEARKQNALNLNTIASSSQSQNLDSQIPDLHTESENSISVSQNLEINDSMNLDSQSANLRLDTESEISPREENVETEKLNEELETEKETEVNNGNSEEMNLRKENLGEMENETEMQETNENTEMENSQQNEDNSNNLSNNKLDCTNLVQRSTDENSTSTEIQNSSKYQEQVTVSETVQVGVAMEIDEITE